MLVSDSTQSAQAEERQGRLGFPGQHRHAGAGEQAGSLGRVAGGTKAKAQVSKWACSSVRDGGGLLVNLQPPPQKQGRWANPLNCQSYLAQIL